MPNMELLTVGMLGIGICSILQYKERVNKRTLRCRRCGTTKLRARGGFILCKNGHKVTITE